MAEHGPTGPPPPDLPGAAMPPEASRAPEITPITSTETLFGDAPRATAGEIAGMAIRRVMGRGSHEGEGTVAPPAGASELAAPEPDSEPPVAPRRRRGWRSHGSGDDRADTATGLPSSPPLGEGIRTGEEPDESEIPLVEDHRPARSLVRRWRGRSGSEETEPDADDADDASPVPVVTTPPTPTPATPPAVRTGRSPIPPVSPRPPEAGTPAPDGGEAAGPDLEHGEIPVDPDVLAALLSGESPDRAAAIAAANAAADAAFEKRKAEASARIRAELIPREWGKLRKIQKAAGNDALDTRFAKAIAQNKEVRGLWRLRPPKRKFYTYEHSDGTTVDQIRRFDTLGIRDGVETAFWLVSSPFKLTYRAARGIKRRVRGR